METVFTFLIWVLINLLATVTALLSFRRINLKDPTSLPSWLMVHHDDKGSYFQVKYDPKSAYLKVYDYLQVGHLAAITFYYGNIIDRIDFSPIQLVYVFVLLISIILFGFITQIKQIGDITITPNFITNATRRDRIYLSIVASLLSGLLIYHWILAIEAEIIWVYLCGQIGLASLYFGLYHFWLQNENAHHWHVHHWFIGWYFSLFFRFDTPLSKVASMVLYGIFIQGATAFNVTPIIT